MGAWALKLHHRYTFTFFSSKLLLTLRFVSLAQEGKQFSGASGCTLRPGNPGQYWKILLWRPTVQISTKLIENIEHATDHCIESLVFIQSHDEEAKRQLKIQIKILNKWQIPLEIILNQPLVFQIPKCSNREIWALSHSLSFAPNLFKYRQERSQFIWEPTFKFVALDMFEWPYFS